MSSRNSNARGNVNVDRQQVADALTRDAPSTGSNDPPTKRFKPDPTMTITSLEIEAARCIKSALETRPQFRLDSRRWSDYDYAQQAITTTADLTDERSIGGLMRQMYKLQCFREEYGIQDNVDEGVCRIQQLMEMMPGYLLSVDFAPRYSSYIAVFDYAAFQPQKLRMPDSQRVFFGAMYYIFQCLSTNLQAARSGAVFITECQDMQCHNFDLQLEEKYISHLFGHYPFRHKECLWLNTPSIANIAYGLLKSMMPADFLATWRMGCKLDGYEGRIDCLFKIPTLAIAQEQLLMRISRFLTERARNAGGFELHERMVCNPPPPPRPQPAAQGGAAAAQVLLPADAHQAPRPADGDADHEAPRRGPAQEQHPGAAGPPEAVVA